MGLKGVKNTELSNQMAELLKEKLSSLDGITTKKMFGGNGVFHDGKMFGLIDSKGNCFLKANDDNKADFINAGGEQHSRMPYYSISEEVVTNPDLLIPMAKHAIKISK
ncbi:MAG: TfoX/Sxy family protein [Bacteroidia bacterium]